MKQIAIRASALTRQFSSVRALNDLTIEVPAGVVFGFLRTGFTLVGFRSLTEGGCGYTARSTTHE
jgi:hypothetical protein